MLKVKVIWESKTALGEECITVHGKFEIRVFRLELGLELINTTQFSNQKRR